MTSRSVSVLTFSDGSPSIVLVVKATRDHVPVELASLGADLHTHPELIQAAAVNYAGEHGLALVQGQPDAENGRIVDDATGIGVVVVTRRYSWDCRLTTPR